MSVVVTVALPQATFDAIREAEYGDTSDPRVTLARESALQTLSEAVKQIPKETPTRSHEAAEPPEESKRSLKLTARVTTKHDQTDTYPLHVTADTKIKKMKLMIAKRSGILEKNIMFVDKRMLKRTWGKKRKIVDCGIKSGELLRVFEKGHPVLDAPGSRRSQRAAVAKVEDKPAVGQNPAAAWASQPKVNDVSKSLVSRKRKHSEDDETFPLMVNVGAEVWEVDVEKGTKIRRVKEAIISESGVQGEQRLRHNTTVLDDLKTLGQCGIDSEMKLELIPAVNATRKPRFIQPMTAEEEQNEAPTATPVKVKKEEQKIKATSSVKIKKEVRDIESIVPVKVEKVDS